MAPCGECEQCVTGDYNMCKLGPGIVLGVGRDGGMADEVIIPERSLVYLPGNLDVKDACLIEPMAVALHGLPGVLNVILMTRDQLASKSHNLAAEFSCLVQGAVYHLRLHPTVADRSGYRG